jgi:hypothetical protein
MTKAIKPFSLYLKSVVTGLLINFILIVMASKLISFSSATLYFVGSVFYSGKAIVFFSVYFLFFYGPVVNSAGKRNLIIYTPFLLFLLWFTFLILFEMKGLYADISYGTIERFPHFYLQLAATFLACVVLQLRMDKRYNRY